MEPVLLFAILVALKHFVVDFPLQGPYQYRNKGKFGHPGGLLHAGLHALATLLILILVGSWNPGLAAALLLFEFVSHYLMDWAKVNINARMGWGPTTHEQFWWLLGFDQYIHTLTYILIGWAWLG
jgi:hypothetical protein